MKTTRFNKELNTVLRKELKEYRAKVVPLAVAERKELNDWVASGNSVYENPYTLYDESGCLMDFIKGLRIGNDMLENPSDYSWKDPSESIDDVGCIPF